jgi:DNA replication and repair protein RecF
VSDDGQSALRRVRFRSLRLTGFRNHDSRALAFAPGHVVFTGRNGAGKTNILEALSLFAPGRGLRRASHEAMAAKGTDQGFALAAVIDDGCGETVQIGTGCGALAGADAPGRILRINGTLEKSADALNDHARIAWLTPAMDGVFTGPAADRRRLIDRMVLALEPAHGAHAIAYEKAMRGRNRLFADDVQDKRWFDALEQELARHGAAMTLARMRFVAALNAMSDGALAGRAFPVADLAITGDIEAMAADEGPAQLADAYRAHLGRTRGIDRQAGRTLTGPHRSEIDVTHRAKGMPAALASTGEQKALLTGMVLFHAELIARASGMTAVLLLDEIGAHFDETRRADLFDILDALGGQAVMTGTEPHLFAALAGRAQHFALVDGGVSERDLPA